VPKWYHTHCGKPQQAPVSWEELRQMAKDGRLSPDDVVKEEGESGWARADSFPELCPEVLEVDEAVEEMDEPSPLPPAKPPKASVLESPLTDCTICGQEIAKEATACPGCGAPNHWKHPSIVRFLKRLHWFDDIPNFEVEARGYVLVGKSTRPKQFLDVLANAVGGLGFYAPMTGGGLIRLLGMSIGASYASDALRQAAGKGEQVFIIDFRHGQPIWKSTDDEFWADVKDFFKLLRFACPSCSKPFHTADSHAGRSFFCPGCGQRLQVPAGLPRKKIEKDAEE
jgi:hypothetical protein